MNINCIYCNQKIYNFYICLFCGNKICNSKKCISEKKSNGKKYYNLIEHNKKCGGGTGLYIGNTTSEIIYLLKNQLIFSGIHVYLNSFGEFINEHYLNDNYILNKIELNKGIQNFIDISFRKKGVIIDNPINQE